MSTPLTDSDPFVVVGDALILRKRWLVGADVIAAGGIILVDVVGVSLIGASGLPRSWVIAAAVVAAAASYAALARLVNWTIVIVRPTGVEIRHRPLPWPGGVKISRDAIKSVDIREQPLKWDFGGLSAHWISALTERGPVTLHVCRDVDAAESRVIASRIRAHLELATR